MGNWISVGVSWAGLTASSSIIVSKVARGTKLNACVRGGITVVRPPALENAVESRLISKGALVADVHAYSGGVI